MVRPKSHKKKHKRHLTIYIARQSISGVIGESAPCHDCYEKMKELGVKTIVYSTNDGTFKKIRFRDYVPKDKSHGRYFIETGFKQVDRKRNLIKKLSINPI